MQQQVNSKKTSTGPESAVDLTPLLSSQPELRQIFLKKVQGECFVPPNLVNPEETHTLINPEAGFFRGKDILVVISKITLTGKPKEGKGKVFEFEQELGLVYECECERFTDQMLQAFAEKNATFNAWPYHREMIQSLMTRMAVPVFLLPLLNPFRQQKAVAEQQAIRAENKKAKKKEGKRSQRRKA
jgi:hypothetical protein